MTALAIAPPFPVFQDVDGSPLTDGYVYVGTSGLNPQTNPLTTYWDAALTQLAAQPLRTSGGYIVNSGSVARVFTAASGYSLVVRNKNGAPVWSTLSISGGGAASVDSALVIYAQTAAELAAGITPTNTFWPSVQRDAGNVKRFGCVCDGVTDDTVAFQRAINSVPAVGGYIFVPGDMLLSAQILIQNKTGVTIEIENSAIVTFTDGAYIGFRFQGGQRNILRGGSVYGSNHAAPLITLVQIGTSGGGNQCPLVLIDSVTFAYASICVYPANTYETILQGNFYSNSDIYVKSGTQGSCTDLLFTGETYASTSIGTNYVLDISSNGTKVVDGYWETAGGTGNTKGNILWRTAAQYGLIEGCFMGNSGEIKVQTGNTVSITGLQMQNSYDPTNLRSVRVDAGGTVTLSGCHITFGAIIAGVSGIVASGTIAVTGSVFSKCATGIFGGAAGAITGNYFLGCTEGIHQGVGNNVIIDANYFDTCTTGVTFANCGSSLVKNVYATCGTNISLTSAGYVDEATKGVALTVTDGATVAHTHPKTPTRVFAQGTVASQMVSVTAIGASNFTVAIKKDDGTAGTSQTIYWETSG